MIQEIIYKCETCKAVYKTQEEAENCEASHVFSDNVYHEKFKEKDKYPEYIVMEMDNGHRIQYKYDKPIIDIIPEGTPYIESIYVSNDPTSGLVILIPHGTNLPNETYTWVLMFDDTRKVATSNEPRLNMSQQLSDLFNNSYNVTVKISSPTIATTQFVIKEVDG